jgi:hypothetical protein
MLQEHHLQQKENIRRKKIAPAAVTGTGKTEESLKMML